MKALRNILLLFFTVVFVETQMYTTRFDNVDFDEIIQNERLLKNFVNCLLDKGRCTPDANELRKVLPDALQTECSKCSDKQKEVSKKVIAHLMKNKPDWWKELEQRYDPDGVYVSKFQDKWI